MRLLLINEVCGITSTGRICADIAEEYEKNGWEVKIAYGRLSNVPEKYKKYSIRIGNSFDVYSHALYSRLTGKHGFASKRATQSFLEWVDKFNPDMIWLHNLHGYYINIEKLFHWLKQHPEIEKKWTLHDCWAFTGNCGYFSYVHCEKWKNECGKCPQLHKYPKSLFIDNTKSNFRKKKKLFTGLNNMKLIVPSKWMARLVSDSFLNEYSINVVYNSINKEIFKPRKSDLKEKLGLSGKKVILGVANVWEKRKGLDDFIVLSEMLDDSYAIVLVGLTKKQIKKIGGKIHGVGKVNDQKSLSDMYNGADIFVNPSTEETFGMTTAETLVCKTETIVYKNTACEEVACILGGIAVEQGVENLYYAITGQKWGGGYKIGCIIKCLNKVSNSLELAKFYTMADYYVNPTYEDNYPTTNLEAIACGSYVITYDSGGAKETLRR